MPGHVLIYRDGKYEIKSYFKARLTPCQWEESQENSNVGTRKDENVKCAERDKAMDIQREISNKNGNELKENNPDMQPLRMSLKPSWTIP